LPLPDILAQEQIEEATYREGERIWRERIADSLATQLEYTQKLAVASDCLARTLMPIAEDEAAWVGLLGALSTSLDQSALLAELGITLNDVGRLGRVWKRRLQADADLAKRLAEQAKTAVAPSKLDAGPVELRPFPWTPVAKVRAGAAESAPVSEPRPGPPSEAPAVQRVQASFQKSPAVSAPSRPVSAATVAPPARAPGFAAWTIEHYATLAQELRTSPDDADAVMMRAGLATEEARRAVHEHFRGRFEREPGLRARFDALLAPVSVEPGDTEEMDNRALKRNSTVPFQAAKNAGPDSTRRRAQRDADERLRKHESADADAIVRMRAAFKAASVAKETAFVDSGALRPALPFSDAGAPTPGLATTLDADRTGDPAAGPALPFTPDVPAAPLGWPLARYVRLCVDLHSSGLAQGEVLAAQGISALDREALDRYWRSRMQLDPTLREEWQRQAEQRANELRRQ